MFTPTFLFKWGKKGNTHDTLDHPLGIAVSHSGRIYVADTNNHRIQVFDLHGVFLTSWRGGDEHTGFRFPHTVAVSTLQTLEQMVREILDIPEIAHFPPGVPHICLAYAFDEAVYIPDVQPLYEGRMQVFAENGATLHTWPCVNNPVYCTVDSNGRVYVTSASDDRVHVYHTNGTLVRYISGTFRKPRSICVDTEGDVMYINDYVHHRVHCVDVAGTRIRTLGNGKDGSGYFNYPRGMIIYPPPHISFRTLLTSAPSDKWPPTKTRATVAPRSLYICDWMNDRIGLFNANNGSWLSYWYGNKNGSDQCEFDKPCDLAVGPDSTIYVCDSGNDRIIAYRMSIAPT